MLWTWLIGLVVSVFANRLGDGGSILGYVIPKTLKIVLDTPLLYTQQYSVHVNGKVEQSMGRNSTPPTPRCSSYLKGSLLFANFIYFYLVVAINRNINWFKIMYGFLTCYCLSNNLTFISSQVTMDNRKEHFWNLKETFKHIPNVKYVLC